MKKIEVKFIHAGVMGPNFEKKKKMQSYEINK